MKTINNMSDHDMLVRLDQKVGDLQQAVKELSDGTVSKIAILERDKADRKEVEVLQKKIDQDFEGRIRILENSKSLYFNTMIIGTSIMVAMIGLIIYHILQH